MMRMPITFALLATLVPLAAEACGGEFTDETGDITSPNYPKKYPKNADCNWNVLAAPGSRIMLKCSKKNFKIKKSMGCVDDYLKINGVYYCGRAIPTEIYTDAPMNLHFHSDGSRNSKGFFCTFMRVTGGPIFPPTTALPETPHPTPSTMNPATPPQTSAKPGTLVPTGPPTTNCDGIVVKNNEWDEGWSGHMLLSPTGEVNGWTVTIIFDSYVDVFEVYTADMLSPTSGTSFTIKDKGWNANPTLPMKMDFLYRFNKDVPKPKIISITFNNEDLCSGGPGPVTGPTSGPGPVTGPTSGPGPMTTMKTVGTNKPVTTQDPNATPGPGCFGDGKYNYDEVLKLSLLFYEAQRSGPLPSNNRVPWRGDSALGDAKEPSGKQVDLTGGYYDAGDHVKFGFPMAGSVTILAWGAIAYKDAYISAGQMSHMEAAVKWGTDYFIKAHTEANVLYGQVGDGGVDHGWWGRPEDMTMDRPAFKITTSKPGSELAGETAAALAAASILFSSSNPSYAAECLKHAEELYSFADNYRGKYSDSIPKASPFYTSWGGYNDELAWAAAWLYYATNKNKYLVKAESQASSLGDPKEFSWDEKTAGARVLLAQLTNKSIYRNKTQTFCDKFLKNPKSPKGLTWYLKWGNLRYVSNAVFICLRAADLDINTTEYYDYARSQIHYMLGDGGRSYVVGYGSDPPQRPHHRSSSCPDPPASCGWNEYNSPNPNPHILYGALVGGPDNNDSYDDKRDDYLKNEVTTDYNAGFQGAVAALRMDTC